MAVSQGWLYEGCWKYLPLHGIQLVLNNVGHMGTGIVVQKHVFSEFTHRVQEELTAWQWGVRTHAHSLALLPHNFHTFGPFTSNNNVQEAMVQLFRQQHKKIFADGICWHVYQWNACIYMPVENFSNCYNNFTPISGFQWYVPHTRKISLW
jgi:hypothetical protein